jgi:hypothetical protein
VSLAARHFEANGIPTVVFGCARDIVEECGVPRFVFSDFPLGSATGKPFEPATQRQVLELGLALLETAGSPGVTVVNPMRWSDDESWKERIFTKAQPFLGPEAEQKWLARKAAYREAKSAGEV